MASAGSRFFDKTVQAANIWLDDLIAELGPDPQVALACLGAVLRPLRDRLPLDFAAHLPLLVRGLYYDQWHLAAPTRKERENES